MALQTEARAERRGDWYLVDAPGLRRPASVVPASLAARGWRVRILGVNPEADEALSFFGENDQSGVEAAVCILFGEFASPGAALEFLGVLSKSSPVGGALSMNGRHRLMTAVIPPESAVSESFCLLEYDAEPASSARRAAVLLFECERPGFGGRIAEVIDRARLVPVRGDVYSAAAYAGHLESPDVTTGVSVVDAIGGVRGVLDLPVDEVMRYPPAQAERQPLDDEIVDVFAEAREASASNGNGVEVIDDFADGDLDAGVPFEEVGGEGYAREGDLRVRRIGVLEADSADEVARVGSVLTSEGAFKLRVDESADEGEEGVFRRSFQVFHVIKPGELGNSKLRAALVGMMDDEAARRQASLKAGIKA